MDEVMDDPEVMDVAGDSADAPIPVNRLPAQPEPVVPAPAVAPEHQQLHQLANQAVVPAPRPGYDYGGIVRTIRGNDESQVWLGPAPSLDAQLANTQLNYQQQTRLGQLREARDNLMTGTNFPNLSKGDRARYLRQINAQLDPLQKREEQARQLQQQVDHRGRIQQHVEGTSSNTAGLLAMMKQLGIGPDFKVRDENKNVVANFKGLDARGFPQFEHPKEAKAASGKDPEDAYRKNAAASMAAYLKARHDLYTAVNDRVHKNNTEKQANDEAPLPKLDFKTEFLNERQASGMAADVNEHMANFHKAHGRDENGQKPPPPGMVRDQLGNLLPDLTKAGQTPAPAQAVSQGAARFLQMPAEHRSAALGNRETVDRSLREIEQAFPDDKAMPPHVRQAADVFNAAAQLHNLHAAYPGEVKDPKVRERITELQARMQGPQAVAALMERKRRAQVGALQDEGTRTPAAAQQPAAARQLAGQRRESVLQDRPGFEDLVRKEIEAEASGNRGMGSSVLTPRQRAIERIERANGVRNRGGLETPDLSVAGLNEASRRLNKFIYRK